MIEKLSQVAASTVDAMKQQPLMLALIIINMLFLATMIYLLQEISHAGQRGDELLAKIMTECLRK